MIENICTILTTEHLIIVGVIILCSIVQSLFGVGLLLFGTPTLLLMGYPFDVTLSYLLPSSIAISAIQAIQGWGHITLFRKYVPIFILPFVALGLISIILIGPIKLNVLIGIVLILTALIRLTKKINTLVAALLKKNLKFGLVITGLIHGATNLGGAPLTIIVNNIYTDKKPIRANIAYAYLLMAISQIIVLFLMQRATFDISSILFPIISSSTYALLGQRIFKISSELVYYHLMTVFISLFGLCLLVK